MKWLIIFTLAVVITPAAFAQIPETPQVVETIGPNYDLTEDYFTGTATWTSHPERIMFEGQWTDFAVIQSGNSIQVASNSVGTLLYDLQSCSYSIYESGYAENQLIPAVSWMPRIAEVGTDNYSQLDNLFNAQCDVKVTQGENWVNIKSIKTQTEDLDPLVVQHTNGTQSVYPQGLRDVAVLTQTLQISTDRGIKETVSVFNGNPEWSNHKMALTQTVHVPDVITLGGNDYNVASMNGQTLDRQWIIDNEAEIFQIADNLNYDFDVGIQQLNAISFVSEGGLFGSTQKIAADFSVNDATPYLSSYTVDPTLTTTGSGTFDITTLHGNTVVTGLIDGVTLTSGQISSLQSDINATNQYHTLAGTTLTVYYSTPTQPSPPTNLSATSGQPIELSWTASSDFGNGDTSDMSYLVQRSEYEHSESPLPINAGSDSAVDMSTNVLLYHLDEMATSPNNHIEDTSGQNNDSEEFTSTVELGSQTTTGWVTQIQQSSAVDRAGININSGSGHIGKQISDIQFLMYKEGSPTGSITMNIRLQSDDSVLATADATVDISTLTTDTSGEWVSFNFDPAITITSDSRILVEYDGGDSSNRGVVMGSNSNNDSDIVAVERYNGSYSEPASGGRDTAYKFYLEGDIPSFSTGTIANQIDDPQLTVKSTTLFDGTDAHSVAGWTSAVSSATGTMFSFENTAGETISYEVEADKVRVAKSSITTLPTDFSDDFTTDKGWVSTDGQYVIDTTTDNRVEYAVQRTNQGSAALHFLKDLQDADALNGSNLDNEEFVLRFKLTSDSVTGSGSHDAWFNFGLYSSTSNITLAEDFLGLDFKQNNAGSGSQNMRFGTSDNSASYSQTEYVDTSLWMNGSDEWYMEIVRTASDSAVLRIFSDDTYSGTPAHEFNLSFGTDDPQDLRYLGGKVYGSNYHSTYVFGGVFDDVQVWDGVTSVSGTTKTNIIEATGQSISTSVPSHLMFTRDASNGWEIFLDGTSIQTATNSVDLGTPTKDRDSSYDGTNSGATTGQTGILGNAWDFDGSNDKVDISKTFDLSGDWSIAGWFNADNTSALYQLWALDGTWAGLNYYSNGDLRFEGCGAGNINMGSGATTNWRHIVLSHESGTTTMYVDGTSQGTKSSSCSATSGLDIGADGTSYYFDGKVDQILIYNVGIDASDVSALYNSGSGTATPSTTNLIAHYDFEQSTDLENQTYAGDEKYYIGQSPSGTNTLPSLDELAIFTSDKGSEASDIYDRGANQFAQVGSTTGSTVTFSDNNSLVSGNTYFHRIVANNGAFDSDPSNVSQSTAGVPPDAPTNLQASINNPNTAPLDVTLTWTDGAGQGTGTFQNYIVIRSPDSTFTTVTTVGTPTATTFTDTVPSGGGTFYYKVSDQSSHGGSPNSAAANVTTPTVPDAPTISLAINNPNPSPLTITTTFTAPANDGGSAITGYHLFHSTDDVTYTQVATNTASPHDHTVSGVGTHYFKAQAVNLVGASVDSTAQSIATPTVPAAINDLSASVISNVQVDLSWSAPSSGNSAITQYKILRDSINIANTTSTSYSDSSLSDNTTYLFNVFAQNNVGTSTASNSESVTTYTGVSGGITGSATIIGATSQLQVSTSVTGGTPTPTFDTFVVKEGSTVIHTFTGNTGYVHLLDESTHNYTIESTDTNHWQQPTISGTISGVTGQYSPSWENNAAYNFTRGGGQMELTVNRDIAAGWDLDCEYRTSTQAAANQTGVHGVGSNMWAYSDTQSIADGKHVYVSCMDGNTQVVSFTSYGPNLITGGLNMLDNSFGDYLGAPAAVLFVLLVAGMFTGRTANTGILVVLALIGVLGFIGMIVIDEATWGFVLIAGVLGLFVGRRFL